jgi:hypothetical protein
MDSSARTITSNDPFVIDPVTGLAWFQQIPHGKSELRPSPQFQFWPNPSNPFDSSTLAPGVEIFIGGRRQSQFLYLMGLVRRVVDTSVGVTVKWFDDSAASAPCGDSFPGFAVEVGHGAARFNLAKLAFEVMASGEKEVLRRLDRAMQGSGMLSGINLD